MKTPMIRNRLNWILGLFLLVSVSQTQEISPVIQCNTGWEITPATLIGVFPNGELNGALVPAKEHSTLASAISRLRPEAG
ncbi:hypothetical protein Naga_101850g1 [Nannochloropsis gaditana]|uniref:Uncharacterized protein n=1 Tax=Nannochloropsis gaditana TaxID=72520 RepID=W7TIJ7_9STRA|nr:hypothetical protein Naga_101850g1 [Nannochloropsis gaditana]